MLSANNCSLQACTACSQRGQGGGLCPPSNGLCPLTNASAPCPPFFKNVKIKIVKNYVPLPKSFAPSPTKSRLRAWNTIDHATSISLTSNKHVMNNENWSNMRLELVPEFVYL